MMSEIIVNEKINKLKYAESILKIVTDGNFARFGEDTVALFTYMFNEVVYPCNFLSNGLTFYHHFAQQGMIEQVKICIKQGVDVNLKTEREVPGIPKDSTALHVAFHSKQFNIIQLFLTMGISVNE